MFYARVCIGISWYARVMAPAEIILGGGKSEAGTWKKFLVVVFFFFLVDVQTAGSNCWEWSLQLQCNASSLGLASDSNIPLHPIPTLCPVQVGRIMCHVPA